MIRKLLHGFRRTGRTQRMLDGAVVRAQRAGYCYVVAANQRQVRQLAHRLLEMHPAAEREQLLGSRFACQVVITLPGGCKLKIVPADTVRLDNGSLQGRADAPMVADHRVFEVEVLRSAWALRQWEAWTNPHAEPRRCDGPCNMCPGCEEEA